MIKKLMQNKDFLPKLVDVKTIMRKIQLLNCSTAQLLNCSTAHKSVIILNSNLRGRLLVGGNER